VARWGNAQKLSSIRKGVKDFRVGMVPQLAKSEEWVRKESRGENGGEGCGFDQETRRKGSWVRCLQQTGKARHRGGGGRESSAVKKKKKNKLL